MENTTKKEMTKVDIGKVTLIRLLAVPEFNQIDVKCARCGKDYEHTRRIMIE